MSEAERTKAERDTVPETEQELVDAASELSFPASDPPAYMGGAAVAGGPPPPEAPREPASDTLAAQDRARGRTARKVVKRVAGGR
ncbi:hypothetical protein [Blastochloris viridis]|nr:hypothetical protein [Blastochloris viridis]ALK09351.1 hypothetical protein BVIR_1570 [Blastochloris viridis]CUU42014.1 hypothetical protein BVIRIDIS_10150 [Blastochloris viridis]